MLSDMLQNPAEHLITSFQFLSSNIGLSNRPALILELFCVSRQLYGLPLLVVMG